MRIGGVTVPPEVARSLKASSVLVCVCVEGLYTQRVSKILPISPISDYKNQVQTEISPRTSAIPKECIPSDV